MKTFSNNTYSLTVQGLACLAYGVKVEYSDKYTDLVEQFYKDIRPFDFDGFDHWLGVDFDFYL